MHTLRIFGLTSIVAASFVLVACNDGGLGSKSPEERVDAVNSAISSPSGTVDKQSVKVVLDLSLEQSKFMVMSDFLQGIPGLYGQGNAACASGSASDGSVDVSCSSGGKTKGSVSYKIEVSGGAGGSSSLVELKFDDVCEAGTCIDGSMVIGVDASSISVSTVMQASLDMTAGGETTHSDWGVKVTSSEAGSSADVVVFDEAGDSYVLSTAVSTETTSGSVSIKGANGEFACTFDGGGASGSCSGSGEFSW